MRQMVQASSEVKRALARAQRVKRDQKPGKHGRGVRKRLFNRMRKFQDGFAGPDMPSDHPLATHDHQMQSV